MRLLHTHNLQIKVGTNVLISDLNWEVQRVSFGVCLARMAQVRVVYYMY